MSGEGTPPPTGQPPGVASDQSMEDILASIRRILNEDEIASPAPGEADAAPPTDAAKGIVEPEPLLLTEDMMVSEAQDPAPPAAEPIADAEAPAMPAQSPSPQPMAPEALLAPAVAAAAAASVSQLLRAVSTERGAMVHRGGPSIEDVVREELRPLLKDWLDQHLPAMVERLVRAEIERVVGRALS